MQSTGKALRKEMRVDIDNYRRDLADALLKFAVERCSGVDVRPDPGREVSRIAKKVNPGFHLCKPRQSRLNYGLRIIHYEIVVLQILSWTMIMRITRSIG